jgi:nicotinamidase-related amidase
MERERGGDTASVSAPAALRAARNEPGPAVARARRAVPRLDALLQILGRRLLIVTGTATNTCVETTVRDAYMRDFDVVIPRGCVAGVRGDWHDAALAVWDHYLGEVVALEDVLGQLAADRAGDMSATAVMPGTGFFL